MTDNPLTDWLLRGSRPPPKVEESPAEVTLREAIGLLQSTNEELLKDLNALRTELATVTEERNRLLLELEGPKGKPEEGLRARAKTLRVELEGDETTPGLRGKLAKVQAREGVLTRELEGTIEENGLRTRVTEAEAKVKTLRQRIEGADASPDGMDKGTLGFEQELVEARETILRLEAENRDLRIEVQHSNSEYFTVVLDKGMGKERRYKVTPDLLGTLTTRDKEAAIAELVSREAGTNVDLMSGIEADANRVFDAILKNQDFVGGNYLSTFKIVVQTLDDEFRGMQFGENPKIVVTKYDGTVNHVKLYNVHEAVEELDFDSDDLRSIERSFKDSKDGTLAKDIIRDAVELQIRVALQNDPEDPVTNHGELDRQTAQAMKTLGHPRELEKLLKLIELALRRRRTPEALGVIRRPATDGNIGRRELRSPLKL